MADKPEILIIDDDTRLLHIVSLFLVVSGYDVTSASSGEEALQILETMSPDLIIADIMMPGLDGIELCRKVRENPRMAAVPVIMFTALSDRVDVNAARAAGATQFITKPFNLTGLGAIVSAQLANRQQATEA